MKMFNFLFKKKNNAKEFFYDTSFDDYKHVIIKPEKPKRNYLKEFKRTAHQYRYSIKWPVVALFTIVLNLDNIINLQYFKILSVTVAILLITIFAFLQRKYNFIDNDRRR